MKAATPRMAPRLTNRKLHYWLSLAAALPALVILATGILLHLKKDFAWIQPPERKGQGRAPAVSMEEILAACRAVPEAKVSDWDDIARIDVRPGRGMLKVTTHDAWEIQLDAETGAFLQSAYRRSDLIEALHDGSWFHPAIKRWIFLPAGVLLLVLWVTGALLLLQPFLARRRRAVRPP